MEVVTALCVSCLCVCVFVCAGRGRRLTDHGLRAAALASQQSLLLRYCGLEVLAYARFRVYYTYIITKRERRAVESQDSAKERGRDGVQCSHGVGNGRGLGVQGICRGVRQSRETLHRVSEAETPRGHPQGTLGVVNEPLQSKKNGFGAGYKPPHR